MGKTEKGAVFLDPALTSPYDFYQYWINDDDVLVVDHLRWLTTLARRGGRGHRGRARAAGPEARRAQQALAFDLTARIHGAAEAERQVALAEAAFAADGRRPGGARRRCTTRSAASSSAPRPRAGRCSTSPSRRVPARAREARRLIAPGRPLGQRAAPDRPGGRSAGAHRRSLLVGRPGPEAPRGGPSPHGLRGASKRAPGSPEARTTPVSADDWPISTGCGIAPLYGPATSSHRAQEAANGTHGPTWLAILSWGWRSAKRRAQRAGRAPPGVRSGQRRPRHRSVPPPAVGTRPGGVRGASVTPRPVGSGRWSSRRPDPSRRIASRRLRPTSASGGRAAPR